MQWGPGVAARSWPRSLISCRTGRAALILRQLAGLAVSVGFLVAARRWAAALLEPFMAQARQLLARAGLLHDVDKTPARSRRRPDPGLTPPLDLLLRSNPTKRSPCIVTYNDAVISISATINSRQATADTDRRIVKVASLRCGALLP
jgi:hypothetical protein